MIVFADNTMIPALKEMWKICFQDEDDYIDMYFKKRFKEDNMIVLTDDNKNPLSMLSLLPAELVINNFKSKKIRYIYAVATLPEYRRKGYCKKLIEYTMNMLTARGEAAILLPASDNLREYYRKSGFTDAFNLSKLHLNIKIPSVKSFESQKDNFEIQDISPKEYKTLRDRHFYKEGYICWDITAVEYAIEETIFNGGYCKKIIYDNKTYGVLYYIDNPAGLCIKEITASKKEAEIISEKLAKLYGCIKAEMSLESENEGQDIISYAMASENIAGYKFSYFNLSLG